MDSDNTNILRKVTTSDSHLVGKIDHKIFNIPQWMLPNIKIDINLKFNPSYFHFSKCTCPCTLTTVTLTLAILHIQKQQIMSFVASAI